MVLSPSGPESGALPEEAAEGPPKRRRRRRGWRAWFARLFALLALAGTGVAIYLAIDSVRTKHPVSVQQASQAMNQLTVANRNLSRELGALKLGSSPQLAIESSRSAAALSRRLDSDVGNDGDLGVAVHAALTAELAYTDAVGSTLNNPRSPLEAKIGQRQGALRKLLQHIPGGTPRAVSGGANVIAYSKSRLAHKKA
ncbi:MAG: hypothetical protein QOG68_805 [Solirubrobacteraceae bacterium]|nr:hypothetical protein [Solirubrobacteraceae bacterium]